MIPLSINLRNFGAITEAEIDLSDISLAAVVGPNGVGKSTLFTTAPMWALFGVGRGGDADDVVRTGEPSCSVAFDFEHQGRQYRVLRTRSSGKRGKSTLELMVRTENGDLYESLSGTTIRETQEKIQALLHLDAETFAASSMILQGRANEFTAKAPGQRKAILTQILGLEIYDHLQEGAKQRSTESQKNLDRAVENLNILRSRLKDLPDVLRDLEYWEAELREAKARAGSIGAKMEKTKLEIFRAEEDQKKANELRARNDELRQRIRDLREEYDRCGETVRETDGIIAEEDKILSAAREYEETKERLAALREKAPRLEQTRARYKELKSEHDALQTEVKNLEKEIAALEIAAAVERPRIEAAVWEAEELSQRIEEADRAAEHVWALEKERSEVKAKLDKIQNARTLLEQRIESCEEKVERLAHSGCVALAQAEAMPCHFLQDAVEAKNALPDLREKLKSLEDSAPLKARLEELKEKIVALEEIVCQARDEWRPRLLKIRPLAEQFGTLESKAELLSAHRLRRSDTHKRMASLFAAIQAVVADGEKYSKELEPMAELERLLPELAAWSRKKDDLAAARERRRSAHERYAALEEEIGAAEERLKEYEDELNRLETAAAPRIAERVLEELEIDLDDANKSIADIHARIGAMRAKRDDLEALMPEKEALEQELRPLGENALRWDKLVRAFGKNGIPAFIIENAVPELERISNEILGQMSNGRHTLRFETQRDLKSKAGVAETLDIIVSDWQGARPYETFSGGEQLRIDLAIRIGLAELLSSRAGNKIEWLVIDEGLSSQDKEHRETVTDAIQGIARRFKRVLVITHIEETLNAFPQVISLSRNDDALKMEVMG
jgi:exonuclease SbcC